MENAKKKRKTGLSAFILDEAEVDDDINEDEDYDADEFGDLIEHDKRSEVDAAAAQVSHDMANHRRLQMDWENKKEEEIEDYYRQKYARQSEAERSSHRLADSEELNEEITQTALAPTVKDPNLWLIKCVLGQEKNVVLQLMRKYIAYQATSEPLQIKSIISPEAVKGSIYIEAYKQTHVKQAIEGIANLRLGFHNQLMVPINEMTEVLKVVKNQPKLQVGQYVRIKRAAYKGDLAQVDYIDVAANQVHLKLKPRIDYTRLRGALKNNNIKDKELGTKTRIKKRPPQKLFDADAMRAIGGEVTTDGDFQICEGSRYRRGLLYKNFPMDAIIVDGVKPSIEELATIDELNVEQANLQLGQDNEIRFSTGDKVVVVEGELINLRGKVLAISGNKITMMPNHEQLSDPLEFQASDLQKYFDDGDHVKVIDGRFQGDTGIIVRVADKNAILISDVSRDEIKVLIRDLQLCPDRSSGIDTLGQFTFGDLVQIDPQTVGVIVRLEKENLQILTQQGRVRQYKSQAVTRKTEARKPMALDIDNNQIQIKDKVKVVDGPHKNKTAEVMHIFRSYIFLQSRLVTENGGIFVTKPKNLQLFGSSAGRTTTYSSSGITLDISSPRITSPHHPSAPGGPSGGYLMNQNKSGGRDSNSLKLIGRTIKIVKGSYKGHIGIVKDAVGANARVELHSDCKTITVSMQNIKCADGGTIPDTHLMYATRNTPSYGSQTPSHGSRTPAHVMQTPMYEGSATPMHQTAQTPRADFGDLEEVSSPKPPPSYATPATPSYNIPETPNAAYAPQTPGLYSSDSYAFSPYPANSPATGAFSANHINSPAGNYMNPASTFNGPSSAAPYNNYTAMTPGSSNMMSHQPHTPGAGIEMTHDWQTPDLVVSIKSSRSDPGNKNSLTGQIGYIKNVSGNVTNVFLPQEDRIVSVASCDLAPVEPKKGDRYKVIDGNDSRDAVGNIVSIDGPECVCNHDGSKSVTFLPLKVLCKLQPNQN